MMSSISQKSLEEKAEELHKKAEKADKARNVEQRVSTAQKDIKRVTHALADLEQAIRNLHFYSGVLTELFNQSQPNQVDDALNKARKAADLTDEDLLEEADEDRLLEVKDDLDNTRDAVENATSEAQDEIAKHVDRWRDDISSARELNRIISDGGSDFSQVIYKMDNFLSTEIDNPANNPKTLGKRWDRLKSSWNEEGGKHGWEAFKTEHNLSDSTVRRLRKFTEQKSVHLSEFSVENLEEIKQVGDLESAIKLRIDSK